MIAFFDKNRCQKMSPDFCFDFFRGLEKSQKIFKKFFYRKNFSLSKKLREKNFAGTIIDSKTNFMFSRINMTDNYIHYTKLNEPEPKSGVAKLLESILSAVTLSVLVFLFLSIFFVTYVNKVENQIFRDEVDQVLTEFERVADKVETNLPYHTPQPILVSSTQVSDEEMKAWSQRNTNTMIDAFKLVAIVFGSMIFFNVVIKFAFPQYISWMSLFDISIRALVYLTFIGFVEFLFLRLVSSQYRTISTLEVKQKVLKKCSDVLSTVQ